MCRSYKIGTPFLLLSIIFLGLAACGEDDLGPLNNDPDDDTTREYTWAATADSMQEATYTTYLSTAGTFKQDNAGNTNFNYWWNAHTLDALVDGYLRTNDDAYISRMKSLVRGIKTMNNDHYPNEFNDDMAWLGLSSMRAYAATGDSEYKEVARLLFEEIKKSWSDLYGGGITWKINTPNSKNAVSNAPVAILAMRLYHAEENADDLEWAKKIYDWQEANLVDPQTGLVWDNINTVDGEVVTNKDWIFTYNIGTWIGAGIELYEVTGEQRYLSNSVKSAKSMMTSPKLTTEGLMRDEGQGDGGLFKGILVRYFTRLIQQPDISESNRDDFITFLEFNAKTLYDKGLDRPSMLCGPNWRQQPGAQTDLSTQLSGLMLMEAAARLKADELFD